MPPKDFYGLSTFHMLVDAGRAKYTLGNLARALEQTAARLKVFYEHLRTLVRHAYEQARVASAASRPVTPWRPRPQR